MPDLSKLTVSENTPILKVIEILDKGGMQVVLVVDGDYRLRGVVTDGDLRRGILKGISLSSAVFEIMNPTPTVAYESEDRESIFEKMRIHHIHQIPVINKEQKLVGLEVWEILQSQAKENWVVLMAGGQGSRLKPLTDHCPKPLLSVGDRPLLETILGNFSRHGFKKFFISVNYKAGMIQDYFGNGSKYGVEIQYVQEEVPLGTAGALSLLPEVSKVPILVMNGDLLTKTDFNRLFDFHQKQGAMATMCVREYDFQVPYGVVRVNKESIVSIDEKPIERFLVNAGIYVLDPYAVSLVPKNRPFDMPMLFNLLLKETKKTVAYPIREYWIDIGAISDFEKARHEFSGHFKEGI